MNDFGELFKMMFPDSEIASEMEIGAALIRGGRSGK